MCFRRASLTLLLFALALPVRATWISPFISEIHYDNVNGDVNEMIAVTGPSGLDLSDWQLVLYNGANGRPYDSIALSGRLAQTAEMWAEAFWTIMLEPDRLARIGKHSIRRIEQRMTSTAANLTIGLAQLIG